MKTDMKTKKTIGESLAEGLDAYFRGDTSMFGPDARKRVSVTKSELKDIAVELEKQILDYADDEAESEWEEIEFELEDLSIGGKDEYYIKVLVEMTFDIEIDDGHGIYAPCGECELDEIRKVEVLEVKDEYDDIVLVLDGKELTHKELAALLRKKTIDLL